MHYTAQQIRLKITYKQLEQKQPKQPPDDRKITKFCAYIYDEINIYLQYSSNEQGKNFTDQSNISYFTTSLISCKITSFGML